MTREKDAFGFYFSSPPVEQYEAIVSARGARSYGDICDNVEMSPGTCIPMVLAAMVENARPGVSQRGNRFLNLNLSDRGLQALGKEHLRTQDTKERYVFHLIVENKQNNM